MDSSSTSGNCSYSSMILTTNLARLGFTNSCWLCRRFSVSLYTETTRAEIRSMLEPLSSKGTVSSVS